MAALAAPAAVRAGYHDVRAYYLSFLIGRRTKAARSFGKYAVMLLAPRLDNGREGISHRLK
jgi:hypothetical protein